MAKRIVSKRKRLPARILQFPKPNTTAAEELEQFQYVYTDAELHAALQRCLDAGGRAALQAKFNVWLSVLCLRQGINNR